MKNVNIVTLTGYHNYGNRLQNYALSEIIRSLNLNPRTIWKKDAKAYAKEFIKYITPIKYKYKKEAKLYRFSKKYIIEQTSKKYRNKNDYYVFGSDQVWNPNSIKANKFLLEPECKASKNIAYAASIGADRLSDAQKQAFRNALKNYAYISVREESAKNLLQSLTDKHIEVVLDPTLLIPKDKWKKLQKRPKGVKQEKKYILCYMLGEGAAAKNAIDEYAKKNHLEIIDNLDKPDCDYGIEEFLYLINHAELVCTDSFHASVFSLIFEKRLQIFKREGAADYMYSRIRNLVKTFGLENCEFNGREIIEEDLNVDYAKAKKALTKEQKKSLGFLKKALDIKDEK